MRCRKCVGLRYHSQQLHRADRLNARASKIERNYLGVLNDKKPRGMRWKTWNRLCDATDLFRHVSMVRTLRHLNKGATSEPAKPPPKGVSGALLRRRARATGQRAWLESWAEPATGRSIGGVLRSLI
jgi:hypothetical protein